MKVYQNISELVGNTPLVEAVGTEGSQDIVAKILLKLESFNPAGSSKDRVAKYMLDDLEADKQLKSDTVIIEPTSGNTGIALAMLALTKGLKVIIVMPDTMSTERKKLIRAYGAELILTDGKLGMKGAIAKANEIKNSMPDGIIAGQFVNPSNVKAHFETTGPEIWKDTDGKVDIFVAGVGTGGTITGVSKYLKSHNRNIKVIAVEPQSSSVLSGNTPGKHNIQGIGAGFVPQILDRDAYDEIIAVSDEAALAAKDLVAKNEGILVGISSGAAFFAALKVAKRLENKGKIIVALMPDGGERYLSTDTKKG